MKALFTGIWNKFAPVGAKPALYTATGSRFYADMAPIGSQLPYCVYSMPVTTVDYWFNSRDEHVRIQIDLYAVTHTAACDLYENCKTLFDDCTLSVTGYSFGKMERVSAQKLAEENCWRWIVDYEVWLSA